MSKKAKEPEKPSLAWQGTYGDMITLMLCFFVMLYNPSEVDVTQMATITQSLQMQQTEVIRQMVKIRCWQNFVKISPNVLE